MGRHLQVHPHLPVDELERRSRAAKEPHERSWSQMWQILWLLAHGRTATELGSVTGYSAYGIGPIATRYNQQGPAGRHTRQHTTARRATPRVAPQLQEELRQARAGPARPRRRPLAWAHRGRVDGGAAGTPRRALARRDLPAAAHAHAPPRSPPAAPGGG
jgi:hypothetical protein